MDRGLEGRALRAGGSLADPNRRSGAVAAADYCTGTCETGLLGAAESWKERRFNTPYPLYQFAQAAVTKLQKLDGLNNGNLLFYTPGA